MTICPIALAVGCEKCPAFKFCPLTTVLGDQQEKDEVDPSNKVWKETFPPDESKPVTFLSSKAVFKGELTFENTLCIDWEFEGKLTTSDKLIVAEEGAVLADIEAGTVICKGKIRGNIIASQKVEIHSTGKILGDVHTSALMIELGAVILGRVICPNISEMIKKF